MRMTPSPALRPRRLRRQSRLSARWLDIVPLCLAISVLAASAMLHGQIPPTILFGLAGALVACATVAFAVSGPRQGHFGLVWAMALLVIAAMSSGPLKMELAGPHLAVWAAALATWGIGFVAARQRAHGIAWAGLIWAWTAVIAWWLFVRLGSDAPGLLAPKWLPPRESSIANAVLFGLGALLGSARALHAYKSAESDDLPFSDAVERVVREGLSGLLLLGFALTALIANGSLPGLLLTLAILFAHVWWDLRATLVRERSQIRRHLLGIVAPLAAIGCLVVGVWLAFSRDESVPAGTPGAAEYSRLQRLELYSEAWRDSPLTGHGVGSIESVGDQLMTLESFTSLRQPGNAQNMPVRLLVETGILGTTTILGLFLLACIGLARGMLRMNGARTLPRLAVMACVALLVHGLTHSSLALPAVIWTTTFLMGLAAGILELTVGTIREETE